MNENQAVKPPPPPLPGVKPPPLPSTSGAARAIPPPLPNTSAMPPIPTAKTAPPPLPSSTKLPPLLSVNTPPPPVTPPQLPSTHSSPVRHTETLEPVNTNAKSSSSLIAVVILLLLLLLSGTGYYYWQKTNLWGLREFNDEAALQLLYGNYDQSKHGVLWTIAQAPKELEDWNSKAVLVVPLRTENFTDEGVEKKVFLTNTLDIQDGKAIAAGEGCHGCTSLVGVAIFEKKYGKWQLVSENKFLSTGMGWGFPPDIKTNFYPSTKELVFSISGGFMNQGVTESWSQLITFKNNTWKEGGVVSKTESLDAVDEPVEPASVEPTESAVQPVTPIENSAQAIPNNGAEVKTGLSQLERALGDKDKALRLANEETARLNSKARATEERMAKDQSIAIQTMLNKARNCLASRDYSCAITNAENILNLDSSNASAQDVKNSAQNMQSEAISNIRIE